MKGREGTKQANYVGGRVVEAECKDLKNLLKEFRTAFQPEGEGELTEVGMGSWKA